MVGFKANKIREVPAAALGQSLRWLILTDNQISELPAELGQCTQLQKLMLAGNRLQALPEELAACTQLELLRIAANRFTALPQWLLTLPRLSWLAYAGNPYCELSEASALLQNPITEIHWQQLDLQHKLGEGASGFIYQANLQHTRDIKTDVAVKLFKGALTSDGLPHSEKAACISAGKHPNLIGVHGKIIEHPEQGYWTGDVAGRSRFPQPGRAAQSGFVHPRHLFRRHPIYARYDSRHCAWHRFRSTALAQQGHHAWRFICA